MIYFSFFRLAWYITLLSPIIIRHRLCMYVNVYVLHIWLCMLCTWCVFACAPRFRRVVISRRTGAEQFSLRVGPTSSFSWTLHPIFSRVSLRVPRDVSCGLFPRRSCRNSESICCRDYYRRRRNVVFCLPLLFSRGALIAISIESRSLFVSFAPSLPSTSTLRPNSHGRADTDCLFGC